MPGEGDEDNAVCKATCKADLVLATNQEMLYSFDRLHARKGACSAKTFQIWEQATGWTYTELRMRAMCSGGVVNICLYIILEAFHGHGFDTWRNFPTYLILWSLPKSFASCNVVGIFKPSRVETYKKAKKSKCQASEILCLYGIVRHYVATIGTRAVELQRQCDAFSCS